MRPPRLHCSGRCICSRSTRQTQEELAAEVRAATVNGALDVERLKFTRAVIDETMRLYPPAFLIARAAAWSGYDRGSAGEEK